ncbi:MAG: type IX secretion system membrane protein PorP/SprF [Bacteroidetes bacterium]|nr:MAG: type IX secretion system membrane protein PorP/SprF [Bacteroidota bacterium]MBL1143497.1 type IX secretion system membrane protein PorP/SprF [Bacteroidota bacterium]NOG56300.1 PorP/SprF family type IX secretion system membrane protein [Bacteroidota bacterium]
MKKTLITHNTIDLINTKRANMKKALISLSIIGLTAVSAVQAQQSPLSNFYNFNEYLINPAQAGYRNQLEGSASHRIQWQGIDGAPKTSFLGVHGALNDKMGLGVKLNIDQTDILQQFNAAISYAYRIKLNEVGSSLSFGVSGIALQNSINYGDAVIGNYADEVINGGDQSGMTFDAEFGILYEIKKFKLGVASSHLFESGVDYDVPNENRTATFERVRQFIAYSSYQFDLNEQWTLEPFVLVRNQGPGSFQFEINALTAYKETLYLGVGYRQEAGYIGRVGFQITDQLMAAYAYEFGNTGVAAYSGGSHEFMLGYRLGGSTANVNKLNRELGPKVTEKQASESIKEETEEKVQEIVEELKEEKPITKPKIDPLPEKKIVEKTSPAQINKELKEAFQNDIKFEFESTNKENSTIGKNESLDKIAQYLNENPDKKVILKGHTCNMGNDKVNTKYSLLRANTVKDYLLSKGVKEEQMQVKAMLDTEPLVPNTSIANRQKNRRVEVVLIN